VRVQHLGATGPVDPDGDGDCCASACFEAVGCCLEDRCLIWLYSEKLAGHENRVRCGLALQVACSNDISIHDPVDPWCKSRPVASVLALAEITAHLTPASRAVSRYWIEPAKARIPSCSRRRWNAAFL